MRQASTHRGIALQRENLRFLLQTAYSRRVDNPPAIAFKNPQDLMFRLYTLR
ncbi:Uncharacterised protein [Salmonella enterica subsp. enterica serovar Bovismorbificans]|uniref:Uncharacterized protein n=1 Tax=Salmonella enterica subsp. enterica serovar Bovismorbificans TaxID=58097 RepID=A0A655DBM4_SALET|nr:Uncharacterised protein [Salmonella enterica subsp. enterica serovar Bovismorbificans]